MLHGLAYAQQPDAGDSNLNVMVVGIAVIAVICGLAFGVIGLSFSRRHPQREIITVAAIFWALICAGSIAYALLQQSKWSSEYVLRLQSGYYTEAQAQIDAPRLPWTIWTILAGVYVALLVWSFFWSSSPSADSR
jgi:hypothetical protein